MTTQKHKGARKIKPCQKKEGSNVTACVGCKKKINVGDLYWNVGLRATTQNERFYSRKGLVWYQYCECCM
tara:strand:+ start:917 stop:1126 length:210 start_codon:yes stop_codon:yes gene_type:complete